MSETAEFRIGCEVAGSDGICGELKRVVIDPVARVITHLVVEPRHRRGAGHLVPIDLVASTGEEIGLRCTQSEFSALEDADETQFLPRPSGPWAYDREQMLSLPYFELGLTPIGGVDVIGLTGIPTGGFGTGMGGMGMGAIPPAITIDRVPAGEVEVRRGEHVHATDGEIGSVKGLVVDPSDHHVNGQELLGVENLHPSVAHHRDERVVLLLGPLDPDHIVEQQLLSVGRRQPRVLEARPVHDHLAQRSNLTGLAGK